MAAGRGCLRGLPLLRAMTGGVFRAAREDERPTAAAPAPVMTLPEGIDIFRTALPAKVPLPPPDDPAAAAATEDALAESLRPGPLILDPPLDPGPDLGTAVAAGAATEKEDEGGNDDEL